MVIFWRLLLAHIIADFTLQTNHVASWKRESRWGMAVHVLTHPLIAYAVLLIHFDLHFQTGVPDYLWMPWVEAGPFSLNGWVCVWILTFLHWLEDEWRVWSIQRTGSPDSTAFFLWDQVVHLAMILAFSPAIPGGRAETWILLLIGLTLLSHFVSVLVYFLENDLWGESQVLNHGKYRYIGERVIGASLFLLPGAWFLLAFGWLGYVAYLAYSGSGQRTWVHLLVGNLSTVLLGLIARGLLSA